MQRYQFSISFIIWIWDVKKGEWTQSRIWWIFSVHNQFVINSKSLRLLKPYNAKVVRGSSNHSFNGYNGIQKLKSTTKNINIYIYFFSSSFQNRTASALNASAGFRCGGKVTSVTNPVETHSATPDGRHFSAISHFSWLIDSWPWTLLAGFFRGFSSHGGETHPVTSSGCNFTEKRNPPTPIPPPTLHFSFSDSVANGERNSATLWWHWLDQNQVNQVNHQVNFQFSIILESLERLFSHIFTGWCRFEFTEALSNCAKVKGTETRNRLDVN